MEEVFKTNVIPTVYRPDIVKSEGKPTLSFKEVKESLIKFLMRAGIPFADSQSLPILNSYKSKVTEEQFEINNGSYPVSCKLLDISVDGKPVYIVVLPKSYMDLDNRQKNKLTLVRQRYKIVIFEESDWKQIGLDISEKEWLKPLSKATMKAWSRKLFEKISELGESVDSKYNLNDLYSRIEINTSKDETITSRINKLRQENLKLKRNLYLKHIEDNFKVVEDQLSVLDELTFLSQDSAEFIEQTIDTSIEDILTRIDPKKSKYKDYFRLDSGKIDYTNKDKLCEFVTTELSKIKPSLELTNHGYGIIEVRNKKTFQVVTLCLAPTKTKNIPSIKIPEQTVKKLKNNLVYNLVLQFNKNTSKIDRIIGDVTLLTNYSNLFSFEPSRRLRVYDSKVVELYSLWLPKI